MPLNSNHYFPHNYTNFEINYELIYSCHDLGRGELRELVYETKASVCSPTVRIIAFQAIDPGSTPGRRTPGGILHVTILSSGFPKSPCSDA
jgi:hypothetical protein